MAFVSFVLFLVILSASHAASDLEQDSSISAKNLSKSLFSIEGKVLFPGGEVNADVLTETRILVNYGQYLGFVQRDGSFVVSNLPAGSYLVEVTNPDHFYEPVRVDITSKGKTRARKVNYIQSSAVHQLNYPLRLKAKNAYKYFQVRETWRITDALFNPMVLMMVLPLLLLLVLPKMMNAADPETQREMQNMQMPKYDMPELSEMMTSLFKGSGPPTAASLTGSSSGGPSVRSAPSQLKITSRKKV